jgi:hypothetical protein
VTNNGTQASGGSLLVSGTNQQVGAIDGTGDTVVNAGASLTANHIIQNALVIGGTSAAAATVTIAASDATGNPLSSSGGLAVAGSPEPSASFGAAGPAAPSGAGANSLSGGLGSSAPLAGASEVPEPSALILALVAGLACLASGKWRRRSTR